VSDASISLKIVSGLGRSRDVCAMGQPPAQPAIQLDAQTYDRALACIHCGLCLPACPTYTENGLEADSPRGRIYLMKGLADGKIDATPSVVEHLDLCLDCRACETACPSGVVYHELIEATRAQLAHQRKRTMTDRLVDGMFYRVFPFPRRLKWAMLPARMLQKVGLWGSVMKSPIVRKLLPDRLNKMRQMLPRKGRLWERSLATTYPAQQAAKVNGKPRARVALLSGCISSVLFQDVNRQTIQLLQAIGCDVVVPSAQGCCGAIHHHGGRVEDAVTFARANVDALLGKDGPEPDFVVSNVAGCGAMLKDYAHLLRDDMDYAPRAARLSDKSCDIMQLLVELAPPRPTHAVSQRVTYHDACHLAHAQRVTDPPRQALSWIQGLTVVPLVESDMCCGAAGTYNLSQPAMAQALAERKIRHIEATQCDICVTGNVGCAMQIQSEAERMGVPLQVMHPVTLLHRAYLGGKGRA